MTISISARRVVICLIVAAVATLVWLVSNNVLHWPEWVGMFLFGFVLIVLGVSIN